MAINPYAPASATGNGTQVDFTFTFPYIAQSHIKASLNGVATTAFTFFGSNILRFTTAPAAGVNVRITRETPAETLATVIQPGGPIPTAGLNSNFFQSLYYNQETQYDAANQSTAGLQAQIDGITVTSNNALTTASAAVTTANAADATATAASSFTQAGAGAVTRSVTSKLRDTVSVKDFGAVGDGAADDTAAIQAALNSSAAAIYIPKGRYKVLSGLTRSGQTRLYGDGMAASVIEFNGNYGFVYTGGAGGDHYSMSMLCMEDMGLECTTKNTTALLEATWVAGMGGTSKAVALRNCDFSAASISGGWAYGVKLINARNVNIDNCRFLGDMDVAPITSGDAIYIYGDVDAAPVQIVITSCEAYFCDKFVHISGWVEGVYLDKSQAVATHIGVLANVIPTSRPLLYITNNHFNTNVFGVYNIGFIQVNLYGNSFYCTNVDSTSTTYAAIQFDASGNRLDSHIVHNDIQIVDDIGTTYGIVINNDATYVETVVIDGNTISNFDLGILLAAGTSGVRVTDSNVLTATGIINNGGNNVELGTYNVAGSFKGFGDGLQQRFGSPFVTLNASGEGVIGLAPVFPTTNLTSYVSNGDAGTHGDKVFSVLSTTPSSITFKVIPNPGPVIVRANYLAFGT